MNMTIAGLARAGGVGVETVRFYQRRGLLDIPRRGEGTGRSGGIRRYGDAELARLRFIRAAQRAGFTLDEVGQLLRLDAIDDKSRIRAMADARLAALDVRIAEMQAARAALSHLSSACDASGLDPCPIITAFEH
ncbi:MerR family transcriptional regulator [Sphingomonas sp. Marseille-Q8236]